MDSYIEVNISNIVSNIDYLSKGKKPCLMVKADGYGMGLDIVKQLIKQGYNYFGVSNFIEATNIRKIDDSVDVLIVTKVSLDKYDECIENNFTIAIVDFEGLAHVKKGLKYHLKIDTGMNRLGFKSYEFEKLKNEFKNLEYKPEGIFTHLAMATNIEFSNKQVKIFKNLLDNLDYNFRYVHVQNSVGCITQDLEFTNMVRPGLGIYGLSSDMEEYEKFGHHLKPVLKVFGAVLQSKYVDGSIGYDQIDSYNGFVTTVKLGYHDGFPRKLHGYSYFKDMPIIGKVCMCQHMIVGKYDDEFIPITTTNLDLYKMATFLDITIYELIVGLSSRIERRYV